MSKNILIIDDDFSLRRVIEKALKNSKKPACVIIAVPDHLHYQVAKDCIDLGLHTLIAKPFTPTYEEGKKIGWKDGIRAIYCIIKYNLRNEI